MPMDVWGTEAEELRSMKSHGTHDQLISHTLVCNVELCSGGHRKHEEGRLDRLELMNRQTSPPASRAELG